MAILSTNGTFGATDTVTSTKLNNIANAATFDDPVDGSTLELNAIDGKLRIRDGGVTFAKLTDVIDDDTMATASNTTLATSESIKAYSKPNFALATKSDTQDIDGTENTWFEITDLNPTITTKVSGSTFIVTPSINWGAVNQEHLIGFKVMYSVNGGTYQDFGLPTSIGDRIAVHATDASFNDAGDMSRATFDVFFDSISYSIGDTISFKVYAQNCQTTNAFYINRSESDDDTNDRARSISTIKVQEIYQ